jgi:membrane protein
VRIGRSISAAPALLKRTYAEWSEDKVPRLAAALAYYTVFSITPLLVVLIAVTGFVFGDEAARGEIFAQVRGLIGAEGADAIEDMIRNASNPRSGLIATVLGVAALVLGATGIFGALQDALNTIWGVEPKPGRGFRGIIRDRVLSFGMVVVIAFLLVVSLVVSAVVSGMSAYMSRLLPGADALWHLVELAISFAVVTALFAMMFKVLPDVIISWRDVWVGAAVTALLFTIGKFAIGLYIGRSSVASVYGAAGSLVVLLVWVYYSAQIALFGAELTQVWANEYGTRIAPSPNAVPVTDKARERQGMPRDEHRGGTPVESPRGA